MKAQVPLLLVVVSLVPASLPAAVNIMPSPGFTITFDGNDGLNFDAAAPPGGSIVPNNLALASNGATAFTSSQLGPQLGIGYHLTANINDGFYGNRNSWIAADADPNNPQAFAGVQLTGLVNLTSIAFGRDNGNNAADDCGGQCTDRSLGVYSLQFTADGGANWTTIGMLNYDGVGDDTALGGAFTSYFRHEFGVSFAGGAPIAANGVRILVPGFGLGPGGTDIDEIEVYGFVPEPTAAVLALTGLALVLRRHRRS